MDYYLQEEQQQEAIALEEQIKYFGIGVEIEDIEIIRVNELYEIEEFKRTQNRYHDSLKFLNITDTTIFPFTAKDPSSEGKTKREMFEQKGDVSPPCSFEELQLLYVSPSIEYYNGCLFNKKSRKWSFTSQPYVIALVEGINEMKNRFFL